MKEIDVIACVGAGRVVPFTPRLKKIRIPNVPGERLAPTVAVEISGDSLTGDKIENGTILCCTDKFTIEDVQPRRVCVILIRPTGENLARHIIYNGNNTVTLRASNPKYPDTIYRADEIEIQALGVGIYMPFD